MARRNPPRKVTYFEPVLPRLARNTIIESTFEVGRRFRCTMRVDCGRVDPGAVIRPDPGNGIRSCPTGWMKTSSRIGGLAATRSISWPPSRSAPVSPWRTDKRACQEKTPAGEPGFQGIAIEQGDLRSIADT